MAEVILHLLSLSQDLFCDATISCDGESYSVHKVVLSACSSFFATVFANTDSQNPVVVLQDVDRKQLESLLSYMYRGEVRIPQPELPLFIQLAESLQVKGLAIPATEKLPYLLPQESNGLWQNGSCSSGPPAKRTRLSEGHGEIQTIPDASMPHQLYTHKELNRPVVHQDVNMNHAETRIPDMVHTDHRIRDLIPREHRLPSMMPAEHRIPHRKYSEHMTLPHMKHSEHRLPRSYEEEHTNYNSSGAQNFRQQECSQVVSPNEMKWNNERFHAHRSEPMVHKGGLRRGSADLMSPSGQASVPPNEAAQAGDREKSPASMFGGPADRMTSPRSRLTVPTDRVSSPTSSRFRVPAEGVTSPDPRFTIPTNKEVPQPSTFSVPAKKETSPGPKFNISQDQGTFQNLVSYFLLQNIN